MKDEEKIYKLLEKVYIELQATKSDITNIQSEIGEVKTEVKTIKDTVIKIENEHGNKLGVLFDGYKQNSEKLDRIETEVAKHEEIILR
jgi:archaellum component FlaC